MGEAATLPQNPGAERALLALVVRDGTLLDAAVEAGLRSPDDFASAAHQEAFAAMLRMADRGEVIDAITLGAELAATPDAKTFGLRPEQLTLWAKTLADAPTVANAARYAQLIRKAAVRRTLIGTLSDGLRSLRDETQDDHAVKETIEDQLYRLEWSRSGTDFVEASGLSIPLLHKMQERFERQTAITGTPSGFERLDMLTAGFQPGELYLLGGIPGTGKTSFVTGVAMHVARPDVNGPVLVLSLEMTRDSLMERILAMEARIDFQRVRTGQFLDTDWAKINRALDAMSKTKGNLAIDDGPGQTLVDIRAKIRRARAKRGPPALIIIDYLQLVRPIKDAKARGDQRAKDVGDIGLGLKNLAKEMNVPVVALVALNRDLYARKDKRPMLSDLRESGELEFHADNVLFLHRQELFEKDCSDKGVCEVIIAKQRNGSTGVVRLAFIASQTRFENLAEKW